VVEAQGKAKLVLSFLVGRTSGGAKDDGLSSAQDGVLGAASLQHRSPFFLWRGTPPVGSRFSMS
jgi:hypothetical protein